MRALRLMMVAALALPFVPAQGQTTKAAVAAKAPAEKAELVKLVERFTAAQSGFEPAVLRELTTDDYVEVSPLGDVDEREKMIGFYGPEHKVQVPAVSVTEPMVRVYGETAVVIAKVAYEYKGPDNVSHSSGLRTTFVAVKKAGVWKLASVQYTGIRPGNTAPPAAKK